ncbi:NAD(P)H-dependent FMN reductase [Streptomyces sp. Amel2xB2]|uniref:NADPH-dependent FMN reductase n=1 Tax=Streptomyces sp. Amel2xB2 TaxID=1305829 RepID=UPI000DB98806|nr:NAD(P)H-dependent oxidoreductase [Streptomyces sp. Amel2xB2]RAJ66900.1 NAD(P)H-dependent FMN reductase [Streptomyces sp. Amel2xB2]
MTGTRSTAATATGATAVTTADVPAGPLRLAVIVGSVREGRFGPVVAHWFAEEARTYGEFEVDVLDLARAEHELPVAFPEFGAPLPDAVRETHRALSERLAAADAFVIVTPEYNHSYPAPLKNTIDWFREEWQAKPAGFVSYGGMAGGQRAVEHLRPVFAELHAVTVRETLSFHMAWERFDEDGVPHDREGTSAAAKGMLRQLRWWGGALREARAKSPYGSAA